MESFRNKLEREGAIKFFDCAHGPCLESQRDDEKPVLDRGRARNCMLMLRGRGRRLLRRITNEEETPHYAPLALAFRAS